MNRYATNWAFYLGHHWSYKRPTGEPQLTFNFSRALADFLIDFQFNKGINIRTPEALEAIAPTLYRRVWTQDNDMLTFLQEVGQLGSVSGDVFMKVAYEEPYVDSIGRPHSGRVRLLPLNPSFCMPVEDTEILTRRGWLSADEVTTDDQALSLDPETDDIVWADIKAVNVFDWDGPVHEWSGQGFKAVSTPDHRWLVETSHGREHTFRWERGEVTSATLPKTGRIITGGGTPLAFSDHAKWDNELVELVAWYVTEGWQHTNQAGVRSIYLAQKKPEHVARIRRLAKWWGSSGASFNEYAPKKDGVITWYLGNGVKEALFDAAPDKQITPEFLCSLTYTQALLFYNTLLDGDGCRTKKVGARVANSVRWTQLDSGRVAGFQMLCAMLGKHNRYDGEKVTAYQSRYTTIQNLQKQVTSYRGRVWCPTTATGTWLVRHKEVMPENDTSQSWVDGSSGRSVCYWTGNCFP